MSSSFQSALNPAGFHAEKIASLWNVFLIVSGVVYALVMLALLLALFHRRREPANPKRALAAVSVATGATVLTLFALLVSSMFTSRGLAADGGTDMTLTVTGRQWWWQVDYEHPDPSKRLTTADEIVIPVGARVSITLKAPDVIHSLWIPNLQGKRDLIPGKDGVLRLRAERAGVYRGQCAEFCGQQHAKMALWVTALAPADYARWIASQRQPARPPSTPRQQQGLNVFMSAQCPLCHNITGTDAYGRTGPDLTHIAGRRSIAAGTLPNRRDALAQWILDPQHVKAGSFMPPTPLPRDALEPLLDYLESLQ
ncbi:MAG TPA: c-type cytochrome [Thermoanaerobaculia bacterium]|nr:c-type cytochrome [Thermoanaerobaculia bacterium]